MGPSENRDSHLARDDVARVDLGGMAVLRATGADRIGFLHRLTTGTVEGTGVGASCRSLLLDGKGHVMGDLRVCVRSDEVRLILAAAAAQEIVAALSRYAVMDDFAVAVDPALVLATALYGPRSAERLRSIGVSVPDGLDAWGAHADAASPAGTLWLVRSRDLGADGLWVFGTQAACSAVVAGLDEAGVPVLAHEVAEALRIEAGAPRVGAEITDHTFPMEVGLAGLLDPKKGCYLGQETIVRTRDRGLVRRRMAGLRLAGDGIPSAGDEIAFEQNPAAGRVTSVGRIPGQPAVALALLATAVPVGAEVHVNHGGERLAARVEFDRPPWG